MLLFMSGFDLFGPINSNSSVVAGLLTAGEWTTATGTLNIVASLSATGYALNISSPSSAVKTLGANYSRLIGGIRFNNTLGSPSGIQFLDGGTNQCGIAVNTTGTVSVKNGSHLTGTVLGTSASSITANTTHYLEWDITFGNAASYQVWMDGASILSGSGDTTATANNSASGVGIMSNTSGGWTVDDFYLFDATGSTNNAVLLTSPRIETQLPTGDAAAQFAIGAAILGSTTPRSTASYNTLATSLYLLPMTPARSCTLNSIGVLGGSTSYGSLSIRPVVYSDSAGPAGLLASGSIVIGLTAGAQLSMPLTTPLSLVAGTRYWLGFMSDPSATNGFAVLDGSGAGQRNTTVPIGTPPATAPGMTAGQATVVLWGSVSGTSANYYEVAQSPAQGSQSYLFDATVGHEDLYSYPALGAPPSAIYAVAIKGSLSKSDGGAKTATLRMKSGATDSAGTNTSIAPGTSFAWATSLFERDPNGGGAWTKTALDAAQSGVKVET